VIGSDIRKNNSRGSGLFGFHEENTAVPTMEDTLKEVRKASSKGDQYQALKSMSKQWHSIKYFSKLYSTLNDEIKNTSSNNFKSIIQKFENTLQLEHDKDVSKTHPVNFEYDRVYTKKERQARIRRYLSKKKNRKKKYFIRYEIRKTLANNRLRNKGKFIKNKKIDINKLIELVKAGD
jgi:hypothetical protein